MTFPFNDLKLDRVVSSVSRRKRFVLQTPTSSCDLYRRAPSGKSNDSPWANPVRQSRQTRKFARVKMRHRFRSFWIFERPGTARFVDDLNTPLHRTRATPATNERCRLTTPVTNHRTCRLRYQDARGSALSGVGQLRRRNRWGNALWAPRTLTPPANPSRRLQRSRPAGVLP